MGLIRAGLGAINGTLADQWKEFFYCDSLDKDTLVVKGQKRTSSRSSNTRGNDNIISNGSTIAVNDGQCMIIVEQGKVVEVCAEPGEFTWDSSTEPSIFTGSLGEGIKNTFKTIGKRFTYGADPGKDQRVYYFNTKEILDNKFGTATPIPFRVVDRNIMLDIDVSVRCNGVYSYRISDPLIFYANVCGNVTHDYDRNEIDGQLKSEFIDALQPAFAKISDLQIRPSSLPAHTAELKDAMNDALAESWAETRGLEIVKIALNTVSLPEKDAEKISNAQMAAINRDPSMKSATITQAAADSMRDAANNEAGSMTGFMGMGMAGAMGGMFMNQAAQQPYQQPYQPQQPQMQTQEPAKPAEDKKIWVCPKCGTNNTGKFCTECGTSQPVDGWVCECGAVNKGKFCMECGKPKPKGAPLYRCDKCGWEPEDPMNPPKFCPQCGDPFNDDDIQE